MARDLSVRILDDDELDELQADLKETPELVAAIVGIELGKGRVAYPRLLLDQNDIMLDWQVTAREAQILQITQI